MARHVCISLPPPVAAPSVVIPGAGEIKTIRSFFLEAYSPCDDARAFMQEMQPVFAALGMPLCILGCVLSITGVFKTSFPYIDPSALAKVATDCFCLSTFTPFGFCGMIRSIVDGVTALLACITGVLGDIVRMESQAAALLSNPKTQAAGQCLQANADRLRGTVVESFESVVALFQVTSFLFAFVGVPFTAIGSLSGSTTTAVLTSLVDVQTVIGTVSDAIHTVCL